MNHHETCCCSAPSTPPWHRTPRTRTSRRCQQTSLWAMRLAAVGSQKCPERKWEHREQNSTFRMLLSWFEIYKWGSRNTTHHPIMNSILGIRSNWSNLNYPGKGWTGRATTSWYRQSWSGNPIAMWIATLNERGDDRNEWVDIASFEQVHIQLWILLR